MITRRAVSMLLPSACLLASPAMAQAREQQELVDKAARTIAAMRADAGFRNARALLDRARGVMVVPELSRGGFIVGGQGGGAVLLARLQQGWSNPAFYSIGGGTFGLQVGFQQAQVVFIILSAAAMDRWVQDRVRFGGQDGIAVIAAEQTGRQDGMAEGRADVVTWSRAAGAYAGITVEGTSVSFNRDDTARYYGRPITAADVLRGRGRASGAERLRASLGA